VAGKGGVGKTLISQALATIFSRKFNTLWVQMGEEESDVIDAGVAAIEKLRPNLSHVKIYPDQALYEYLSLKIPGKFVRESFLKQNLLRSLCSIMPGLSDLTRLGKIWFHADESSVNGHTIFEKIVVDMPSSGFVERFLSIASVVEDVVKIGPLAREAHQIRQYFYNPKHARLHLVTMLEDLVVTESIELAHRLEQVLQVVMGALFINMVLPPSMASLASVDEGKLEQSSPQIAEIVELFKQASKEQTEQRARFLNAKISLPMITVTDAMGKDREPDIVAHIIEDLIADPILKDHFATALNPS